MNNTQIEPGKKSTVELRWHVSQADWSAEGEKEIKLRYAKAHSLDPSCVRVKPCFINSTGEVLSDEASSNVENIQDPLFQQQLFKKYIAENGIKDYDIEKILEIDSQINSQIDYGKYDRCGRFTINYIDWSNFLCYGPNNHFDFTGLKGLVLLNGKPANQCGKTSFAYDLMHFVFFGKTRSGKADTLKDYFNRNLPEATEVSVVASITSDNKEYIIKRTITRAELGKKRGQPKNSVEYYRVENGNPILLADDESNENVGGDSNVETNKEIKKIVGREEDFDMVVSANMDSLKNLITMKDTERGKMLTRWIGLQPIEDKCIIAKDMWNKAINPKLLINQYSKPQVEEDIEQLQNSNKEYEKEINNKRNRVRDCDSSISEITDKRDKVLASKKPIDENLEKIDVHTVEEAQNSIANQGKAYRAKIAVLQARIAEIGNVSFDNDAYKNANKERLALNEELSSLRNDIKNLKHTNQDLASGEYCPVCHRKFENVDNSAQIALNNEIIQAKIEEGVTLKAKFDSIESAIEKMDSDRLLVDEKSKAELSITAMNVQIESLLNSYKANKKLLADREANKEAIVYNNDLDAQALILKTNIAALTAERDRDNIEIASLSKDIKINEETINQKKGLIAQMDEELILKKNWQIYLTMIGKDGISKMVLRNSLPIINAELNRLLDGVADFTCEVAIDDTNDVNFYLVRNGIKGNLSSGSGFEQTVAALALRVVLGCMSTLSRPPFLLLDEILGGVAKENYDKVKLLYDKIQEKYTFIFQITHLEDIVPWHNTIITVVKDANGISSVTTISNN